MQLVKKRRTIKKHEFKELSIYTIFDILQYLYFSARIGGSVEYPIVLKFVDWQASRKGVMSLGYPSPYWKLHDIYGKWGSKNLKKVYFLWKTFDLTIFKYINNEEEFKRLFQFHCSVIQKLSSNTRTLTYYISYEHPCTKENVDSWKSLKPSSIPKFIQHSTINVFALTFSGKIS